MAERVPRKELTIDEARDVARRAWLAGFAGLALMTLVAGCDNSERNVITERAPFYQTEVAYDGARIDAVIETVRSFSTAHQMDFLVARKSLEAGDFNASANGPAVNLTAMHIASIDKGVVGISAIARGEPTPQDRALVDEFVGRIRMSSVADGRTLR